VLYTLISASTRSPAQADYLFARTWNCIYNEMRALDLMANPKLSLQSWLVNIAAIAINRFDLPPVEEIQYSLTDTPPVFWCYLNQAIEQLPGNLRLVLLLSQTFHWSNTRIAAYLQAEGEPVSANDVQNLLAKAFYTLESILPEDVRDIYLTQSSLAQSSLTA
jgi:DNA-directed RNA polymerase specialized sigma24 family protein